MKFKCDSLSLCRNRGFSVASRICLIFFLVGIITNYAVVCSEVVESESTPEPVQAPVITSNSLSSTVEPLLLENVGAEVGSVEEVPESDDNPMSSPEPATTTTPPPRSQPSPGDSVSSPGQNGNNNEDKVGQVQQRAIRSLMKIFGLPDDTIETRGSDQFGPAPEFMIDLYNTITDNYGVTRARNPYGAHVIRSFMERDSSKYDYFFFNLSAANGGGKLRETERVVEAELHLYRNPTSYDRLHPSLKETPFYILSLYQVVDMRNLGIPDLHKLLGVHYVQASGSGWEVFNVTQTVMEWMNGKKQNLGFIVAAESLGGNRVPVSFSRRTDFAEGEKSNKQPILVLFNHDSEVERMNSMTQTGELVPPRNRRRQEKGRSFEKSKENGGDGSDDDDHPPTLPNIPNSSLENPRFHHSLLFKDSIRHPNSVSRFRSRRSKNQTEHGESSDSHPKNITSCSKHDLFISFEAIGWSSWIISPKGYNAYYCTGPCVFPLSHDVSPTNHATLQSIAHELSLAADVGRPCCVPTKLLPISLLYYDDDDNVVLKQYVDMVADTCGCH